MRRQHYSCVVPRSCTVRKIHGKKSVVLIERVCMHIRHANSYLNLTFSPSLWVFCLLIFVNSANIQWYCGREQAWVTTRHLLPCTVRKFNWWRYFLALCDQIFDHFPLFDCTLHHILPTALQYRHQSHSAKSARDFSSSVGTSTVSKWIWYLQ